MDKKTKGTLVIIGGAENKDGNPVILEEVARRATRRNGYLVIITVATQHPEEVGREYTRIFKDLGVKKVEQIDIRLREDAHLEENIQKVLSSSAVFFTGGDQLRITSQVGDSPVYRCMRDMYTGGGLIVGTSAGAAAMSETMLIAGPGDKSAAAEEISMAPGLGFLSDSVIDSHFAERGRIGRLMAAVAQNPKNLGIGIDEDTAIIVEKAERFKVLGAGAVYVADGATVSYSSLSDRKMSGTLSVFDTRLHVLADGDSFDLLDRQPVIPQEAVAVAS